MRGPLFWIRLVCLLPLGIFIVIAQRLGFNPWNVNAEGEDDR
jgi:hypothetical protein